MDGYLEQAVNGSGGGWRRAAYALCWVLIALLLICAMAAAASLAEIDGEGTHLRWPSLAALVLCLGGDLLLYRGKDALRREYDYIFRGDALEIYEILNRRRRRKRAEIALEDVTAAGPARGAAYESALRRPRLVRHSWHIRRDGLYFLCYTEKNCERHMALLELSEAMVAAIRASRKLPGGAWRDGEERNRAHGSLS